MRPSRFLTITVALVLALSLGAVVPAAEAYTWYGYEGHQYALTSVVYSSWNAAQAEAVAAGGYLVSIKDAGEQAFLNEKFGVANEWKFIGFHLVNNQWVWTSGEAVTYTNWQAFEPNGSLVGETVAIMGLWSPGEWADVFETNYYSIYGIIETPLPGALVLLASGLAGMAALRRRLRR